MFERGERKKSILYQTQLRQNVLETLEKEEENGKRKRKMAFSKG